MSTAIVSDSSSLILIFKLNLVYLLENEFGQAIIPQRVFEEATHKDQRLNRKLLDHKLFNIQAGNDQILLAKLDGLLDYGEAEAISIAKSKQLTLLIDEKKGRKIAAGMNIPIIGFLGLILLNHRHGHLSDEQASTIFNQAKEQHFRISQPLETQFKTRLEAQRNLR
jgi:predicted nucleic acid-binding protein